VHPLMASRDWVRQTAKCGAGGSYRAGKSAHLAIDECSEPRPSFLEAQVASDRAAKVDH
jgi:hypothetical protein